MSRVRGKCILGGYTPSESGAVPSTSFQIMLTAVSLTYPTPRFQCKIPVYARIIASIDDSCVEKKSTLYNPISSNSSKWCWPSLAITHARTGYKYQLSYTQTKYEANGRFEPCVAIILVSISEENCISPMSNHTSVAYSADWCPDINSNLRAQCLSKPRKTDAVVRFLIRC